MFNIPQYIGPMAFGIKMGVILPGTSIVEEIFKTLQQGNQDGLLGDGDVLCITESVVARSQTNYVTVDEVSRQIKEKLSLQDTDRVSVVFPIASRNRFSLILKGIALAVPRGEVAVQLSFPRDEVGNQIISPEFCEDKMDKLLRENEVQEADLNHPVTKVNYLELYRKIIEETGAKANVYLSNQLEHVFEMNPQGVIAADIHTREKTRAKLSRKIPNCITLQDICNQGEAWSEWGLLGSNLSSNEKLKLAPRNGEDTVNKLQQKVREELGKNIEVLIYGDGAYKDPSSGIYELADPRPVFASTNGLGSLREGIKYKYLADQYHQSGKTAQEIEAILEKKKKEAVVQDSIEAEGTTPRPLEDILASLADLISGSSDEGTPLVLVKGFNKQ